MFYTLQLLVLGFLGFGIPGSLSFALPSLHVCGFGLLGVLPYSVHGVEFPILHYAILCYIAS